MEQVVASPDTFAADPDAPPPNTLDPRARALWQVEAAVGAVVALALAFLAWRLLDRLRAGPSWAGEVLFAAVVVWQLWEIVVHPGLRWRSWRWGVGEAEIDLLSGWWTRTRTVVPLARIQHVDTRRGPLERRLGLATVVLWTAAGANAIPALRDDNAVALRERIAALANVREDL